MAVTSTQIQQLYVAYFARPADPVGLNFYIESAAASTAAGTSDATILDSISTTFAASAEYTANFTGMSNAQIVNQVYQNLFSHAADTAGLLYWAGKLTSGALTVSNIVRAISTSAVGASNVDGVAFNSKVSAAVAFTASLTTADQIIGYSGTAAGVLAKAYITSVNSAATLATAIVPATLTSTVTSVVAAGNYVAGSTFTLTTSADSGTLFTGGAGNDTYNSVIGTNGLVANGTTLNPGDNLNGGSGTDTLAISVSGTHTGADLTVAAVSLAGIETITVSDFQTADGFDTIIDLSTATGVTTIAKTSSSASGDTGFTGVKAIVAAKLQNGAGDLSITYADTAVVGTADTQTLELTAVTAGTFSAVAATGGIETLAITSTGSAANVLTGITNAASLKTITVAGTQNVTLGTLGAAVTTLNASASTAGVIATAGDAVDYAITGGAGNDTLTVTAANITSADTINGGAGTADTIKLGAAVTAANMANVTGFEVLEETTNNVAQTLDGLLSGVTKLVSSATSDGAGNTVSFTNVGSGVTELQVTGTEGIIASLKTNGTADAVTLTYGSSSAGFTVAGQTTLNDYETISIVSQGGANNTGAFGATQVTTMNASGSKALTIGATTATALATINASAMTASFIMTDNSSTAASTITGGTGADTLFGGTKADVIVGGAGSDAITGGAGADNLSGGDGNDTFTVVTVSDFTTGVETVAGGAGDDTLSIATAGNATITLIAANLAAISGIETLSLNSGSGASSVTLSDAVYTANGQTLKIVDADLTQGTLTVDGSALTAANSLAITANTVTGAAGTDTLTGGAGNDSFTFSTAVGLEAVDTVVGGAGIDTIFLTATAAVTAVMTGVRTVENVTTTGTGGNISVTVGSDAVIAASSTLTTSAASSTTTGNTFTYVGSAVTTATKVQNVTGSAGNDAITGGSGNDIISGGDGTDAITGGAGIDNLSGGNGIDTFTVNLAAEFIGLATAETVSGVAGNDILSFAAGVGFTVAAADLAAINSIETIQFLSTTNNDTLTLSDAVFTANAVTALKIDAAAVTTGDFILSASGLSAANSLTVTRTGNNNAGTGDNIVLGAGNDTLLVRIDLLDNATTTLTGGAGTDTLTLSTTATAILTSLVTGFEQINFAADIVANLTTVDQNVAAGVTFTVDGTALTSAALTFNGSAELDGKFSITGAVGADALTGGLLADTISGGQGADTITGGGGADSLTGGIGADVFVYTSASVAHSTGTAADTITDFATTSDKISVTLNYSAVSAAVDVNTVLVAAVGDLSAKRGEFFYDSTAGALSINVNNDNIVTTQDIKINVGTVASGDLIFAITGSAFGDVIVGGAGLDTIVGGVGADSITGGNGADVITAGTSAGSAIRYAATTVALMTLEGGDTINGFGVLSGTNDDVFNFATGLLSNGTSNAQDVVTAGGTIGANDVVLIATDAIAGAENMATAAGAFASFNLSYTTQTNLADGDRILFVASGTGATTADTYMWLVSKGAAALAATDFTLVGIIAGLANAVAADLGADGVTITTIGAYVNGTDFFTIG